MGLKETEIELHRNDMKFSVAHFTIFSAQERERIHGHNFYVSVRCRAAIHEGGVSFDYRELRHKILDKCKCVNERFLLPAHSPHLTLEDLPGKGSLKITFDEKEMVLLKEDVMVLPLENISSESLAFWFLEDLLENSSFLERNRVSFLEVKISTTTGQSSSAKWGKNE